MAASAPSPTISILLPFYQAQGTLADCLDSLLAQTDPDFEIVAVDDGSTDDGAALVQAYADRDARVRLLRRPHQGLVAALNTGLGASRSTYVARMDADDIALPLRLERQRAWLESNPQTDLVGCLVEPFTASGRLSAGVSRYHAWMNALRSDAEMRDNLFVESPLPHPAFFARRNFFLRLWGYRDLPWPEDYDLLLRAAISGARFAKVPEVLVRGRDHAQRLTRTDARYRRDGMFRAKVHHFVRGPWLKDRSGVVVGGSGTSGRRVATLLREAGITVHCLLDNKVGPPGRKVLGLPAVGYPDAIPADFFAAHPAAYYLSCIGEREGRERLVRHLEAHNLRRGPDWQLFL